LSEQGLPSSTNISDGDRFMRQKKDRDRFEKIINTEPLKESYYLLTDDRKKIDCGSYEAALLKKRELEKNGTKVLRIKKENFEFASTKSSIKTFSQSSDVVLNGFKNTFSISSYNPATSVSEMGTGYVVEGKLVTCAHCIMQYDKTNISSVLTEQANQCVLTLDFGDGKTIKAKLNKIDFSIDIALLDANINNAGFSFDKETGVGSDIFVIGSPIGFENNVTHGVISSFNRDVYSYVGAPQFMFFDAAVTSGNSGGPVISKETGGLVGMVVLVIDTPTKMSINAGLPYFYIEKFINNLI
jgi:S1-C subfamily serine protease